MSKLKYESDFFKAISHPTRIAIIKKLGHEEICVCEFTEDIMGSQSSLSQHLKVLKDANILSSRRDGMKILYQIKDKDIFKIIELADEIIKKNVVEMMGEL